MAAAAAVTSEPSLIGPDRSSDQLREGELDELKKNRRVLFSDSSRAQLA
jgi:hypothetical protein